MFAVIGLLTLCVVIPFPNVIAQQEIQILTLNTGLQFSIPWKQLRRRHIMNGIRTLQPDVVCLQEMYHSSDIEWLRMRLVRKFPEALSFSRRLVNTSTNAPLCQDPNVIAFLQCMAASCSGFNMNEENGIIDLVRCLKTQCGSHMFSMPQECLTCLFLFPNSTEALSVCMNPETEINVPGLVLLSKKKFTEHKAVEHHPNVVEIAKQGYLYANVNSLPFQNYVAQNLAEIKAILETFKETKPLLLIGDLNTGPELTDQNVCAYNKESYEVLTSPNSDLQHTIVDKCTYCKESTWTHADCDLIIDHIFTRCLVIKDIKRIYDDPKVRKKYHMSDHFGVMAKVVPEH
ncbi:hypothetical protein ACJMK2_039808 [Sinanodonta woodiana]|uniref:Endonuclease/exonuclease/phosphatase domain-containing protein n=1 Tax=Sinanodonta woodiana TaxID=1069815 RepID=A0ABD3WD50_SINWO